MQGVDNMILILLGPPGSGKGTQAKALSQKLNISHISTGDILREEVKAESKLGKEAKGFMDKGELVPDRLVTEIIRERLSGKKLTSFLLDGYPRNIAQAQSLDQILAKIGLSIGKVIYLDVSESVVIQRLSGRRVCQKCGHIFHITNMPPKKDMICDLCGSALFQRDDDKVETIKRRLNVYLNETASLIDYYKAQNKLLNVLADRDVVSLCNEILNLLKKNDYPKNKG